jgi:hypothetical protein
VTGTATVAPQGPCLDYRCESHTARPGRPPRVYNRVRVFRTGEVEVRTVLLHGTSRPPAHSFGVRRTRGVSRRGGRLIRRAVGAYVGSHRCRPTLYTLTSQGTISDEAFTAALVRWLGWVRKWVPGAASHYVWTKDLQQRGVLHAHVLLFHDMPRELWLAARSLWCDTYGMGPGAFDVRRVKRASRAATYLARYISRHHDGENRRVGRNGLPYVRESFRGNAYGLSGALRAQAAHVTELALEWTTGPVLGAVNLRGCVWFFASVEEAHAALAEALGPPPSVPQQA